MHINRQRCHNGYKNSKVFDYSCTRKNITKASKILHVTQPTLSRQLQQIEEMEAVLFRRSRHSIILTEKGQLLFERAKEIVAIYDTTQKDMSRDESELQGEILIGCGETKGMSFLAEQMMIFQKRFPMVRFKIYSAIADDIKKRLENSSLNLGLLTEPVEIEKYEYLRIGEKDQWGILTRKDSHLANKEEVYPEDFVGVPLILPVRDRVRGELASWFGDYADQLQVVASCNLMLNEVAMVKQGMGTAVCLNLPVYDEDVCFIPLSPVLTTGSVLVWKNEQYYNAATLEFFKQLRNVK